MSGGSAVSFQLIFIVERAVFAEKQLYTIRGSHLSRRNNRSANKDRENAAAFLSQRARQTDRRSKSARSWKQEEGKIVSKRIALIDNAN